MKIAVAGAGYVGLSLAVLLARRHEVRVLDVDARKVAQIKRRESPLAEPELARHLSRDDLMLHATLDPQQAYAGADFIIVATPTDYEPQTGRFDTQSVEAVIRDAMCLNPRAVIVIRSTVPVGFTRRLCEQLACSQLMFSPEFLREDRAVQDCLHPSRIVVGERSGRARVFAGLLQEIALRPEVPVLYTDAAEAEAIKLFANTYLAMRVAFFNELDTYAGLRGLDASQIIEGVGLDPRIGTHYNNPSFGYGGYCLPKDTRQLLANYEAIPQDLIRAIVDSNETRLDFIASDILRHQPRRVGIYRLVKKAGASNVRHSSVQDIMARLQARGVQLVVYEPLLQEAEFGRVPVSRDLAAFKASADLIVANRRDPDLADVAQKVYTRDLFGRD